MAALEIELNAWAIPDDHRVFKCSPGKTYRFFEAVRDSEVVFTDIRGLGELEGNPTEWTDQQLVEVIAADRWARELAIRARHGGLPIGSPLVSPTDRARLTFLKELWFQAKQGDLVVIPNEGYRKEILIGEFTGDPGEVVRVEAKDGDYTGTYFGRPVRWRRRGLTKLDLPPELIAKIHTQTALFTLGESLKEMVYRLAYGNFIYRGNYVAEFRTSKTVFTAEDHAVVSTWLNGLDVLRYHLATGTADAVNAASFAELGLMKIPGGQAAEVRIDIQSPGEIYVRTRTPFALTLMALFALAACGAEPGPNQAITVNIKSVAGAAVDVKHLIDADLNDVSTALGDKRPQMLAQGRRAATDAKLSTEASLKQTPKGRT